ncbi:MAG: sugar phosphate isomerase/epimerase [Armatimonadetes bacterium]|nr:sugar phosphate isomerase/epimerase [Armatimonadota bacterium]MDE2205573.1 sugar phosphate isomerase/epimerase [Armatimonadota bacterium]
MLLTAITDEITQDFDHALDVMLEYGCKAAELRGMWGVNIADLSDADARRVAASLQSRGMRTACLSTPFFKCSLDGAEAEKTGPLHLAKPHHRSHQLEVLKRCIELAHRFETRLIRVFAFWRNGDLTADQETRIVDAFAEPIAIASEADVVLCLENEHACMIGTGAEAARIAAACNSDHFAVVWDPGNAFAAGEVPYPGGYEAVQRWVQHVHIKDAVRRDGDTEFVRVGEGEIDYENQFRALRRDGYTGYISIETHYRASNPNDPGSEPAGEWSTRECLAAAQDLIQMP